jgi:hypothetical protein
MKMVKSLILGTAVAFAASAGAQAADLPVKAKPVSYVKICPQYGPGFYYIPGTDICLKIGGSAFAEVGYNQRNAAAYTSWGAAGFTLANNYSNWRSRLYLNMDARNNTAYGTVRAVLVGGIDLVTANNGIGNNGAAVAAGTGFTGVNYQWAFFQFAGFTFGTATSFFDFAPNMMTLANASTPWGWNNLIAYTAQLGNGLSATISIEDPSGTDVQIVTAYGAPLVNGYERPDVVANIRLDQAWGSAQIMAAVKEQRFTTQGDENGSAFGAGIAINLPWLAAGDQITFTAVTARGATEYTGLGQNPLTHAGPASTIGLTGLAHAAFSGNVQVDDGSLIGGVFTRTDSASMALQFRHYWTPTLRSAFHAGYTEAYNLTTFGGLQVVQYGHALIWTPVAGLNFSLDVLFTETDVNNVSTDIVSALFRARRDF